MLVMKRLTEPYQTALENDDNPFITTREIGDFKTFVENSRAQETQTTNPDYSTMTTYYALFEWENCCAYILSLAAGKGQSCDDWWTYRISNLTRI